MTRDGDVRDRVGKRDDRLVLVNSGDALTLTFDAGELAPPAEGLVRTFFFHSVGWDKDGDYNVRGGDVVDPLPTSGTVPRFSADAKPPDWRLEYNTRWVARDRFQPTR